VPQGSIWVGDGISFGSYKNSSAGPASFQITGDGAGQISVAATSTSVGSLRLQGNASLQINSGVKLSVLFR
jgi:hypothetical protein